MFDFEVRVFVLPTRQPKVMYIHVILALAGRYKMNIS